MFLLDSDTYNQHNISILKERVCEYDSICTQVKYL